MSVEPGAVKYKDPDAVLVYRFDWAKWLQPTAAIAESTITISGGGPVGPGDTPLTADDESIEAGDRAVLVRLTGGVLGRDYTLSNRIVTNETPSQREEKSITIRIRQG